MADDLQAVACSRCRGAVSTRSPSEGITQQVRLTKTTVTWKLRFSRFHWRWIPQNPWDRVRESYTTLALCDWCAGDVLLFVQGLPPRAQRPSCPQDAKGGYQAVPDE